MSDARDRRYSAAEIAGQHKLRKRHANEWRGTCPACGYVDAFVLSQKGILPLFWCANGCDREQLKAVVFGRAPGAPPLASFSKDRTGFVRKLWGEAKPCAGSIVETYLASRGLKLPPGKGLRFERKALHSKEENLWLPAMRAAVRDAAGDLIALHTTYLREDGSGTAAIEPKRRTLASTRGGAVRLFEPGEKLILAEGIETAIAAAELLELPAWAALNAGNLGDAVTPPRSVGEVVIAVDRDEPGQRAASKAMHRLRGLGFAVRLATPNSPGEDFNDILLERRRQRGGA